MNNNDAITPENLEGAGWATNDQWELDHPLSFLYSPAWTKTVYSRDEDNMLPSYLRVFIKKDGTVYICSSDGIDEVVSPLPIHFTTMTQLTQLYTALGGA